MGLILKKENHDEDSLLGDFDIIERTDTPNDLPTTEFGLVGGKSAEDIARKTDAESEAAKTEAVLEDEAAYNRATMAAVDVTEEEDDEAEPREDDALEAGAVAAAGVASAAAVATAESASSARTPKKSHRSGKERSAKTDKQERDVAGNDGSNGGDSGDDKVSSGKNFKLFAAIAIVAVIVAAIVGYFIGSGGMAPKTVSGAAIAEEELDNAVASWSYNGEHHTITAREAIESQFSLDSSKNEDGLYTLPAADTILSYVRTQIQLDEADQRGITVTDDEVATQAENTLGTSDYATIASQYQVSEDQAKEIVRDQTIIAKLSEQVAPISATMPEAPTEPADGNGSAASKEYADYIIALAGDEWDASKGTWAKTDGAIATALSGQQFTADSATYDQALSAYYAAYQQYAQEASEASTVWKDFANQLFAKADIEIYGLYV